MDRERAVRAYEGTRTRARSLPIPAQLPGTEPRHAQAPCQDPRSAGESGKGFMSEERADKANGNRGDLRLSDRLALRPKEAAEALGISERTLRQLLPELPTIRRGRVVLVPIEGLREWLRDESRAEGGHIEKVVGEILGSVNSGGKD